MPFISDCLRFFAGAARVPEGKSSGEYEKGYTSMIRREPLGVTAGICPWNYPLMMAIWKIGPALAAGNTSIIKPAQITPLTTLYLAELTADIFPPGVVNVVTGPGAVIGEALTRHPAVRLVSVTGDTSTGKRIAAACAETVKRAHLELGGKAPVVVFDDADVQAVVDTIKFAGYTNTGQDCTASCRVIAGPKIYDESAGVACARCRVDQARRHGRPVGRDGSARLGQAARERAGVSSTAPGKRVRTVLTGGEEIAGRRFPLPADRRRRRRPESRDRPAGGLRAGRVRAALLRRGAGCGLGERRRLRIGVLGLDP